ncbi:glyoxalase [Bacillaceae bacterium SIJ1]|uniref:VOC family protein n=1 Tax=Litoribacterium kuwaitense TaxID=1398745 RepID=UPI0013EBE0B5|nr:VOC family protein [Litoribacterium kuwaitense]NGP44477.1 glyoxalase [Litoribacterium kuwaitense]
MIELQSIHHVSLVVTNMDDAREFYEKKLGLKPQDDRPDFGFPGAWYTIGSQQLHLINANDGRSLRGTNDIDSRDGHVAFRVQSIAALLQHLEDTNVPYLDRPNNKTPWHQVYVTDPSGNVIEFNAPR